jgi:hypothetical protein
VLVTTKGLPGEALQEIPVGGSPNPLSGNGKPQASNIGTVGSGEQRKVSVGNAARILEDAPVMLRREQALPTAEGRSRQRFRRYGVRRARPLARRDWMTLRPLRVAIRARKPCVRARLMRLGWKVRFIVRFPG